MLTLVSMVPVIWAAFPDEGTMSPDCAAASPQVNISDQDYRKSPRRTRRLTTQTWYFGIFYPYIWCYRKVAITPTILEDNA
jgi:hypothetical protein